MPLNLGLTQEIALHNDLILLTSPLSSLTNDRICMTTTNVRLSRTPAGRGSLLCKSGPICIISLITRHNSLIITGLVLRCLHTSIFIETPSLEGLPTKAKEDPSPHEMRLSSGGHQPSIS